MTTPEAPTPEKEEEFPPRSQWTEQEKETVGPQTIMEMRWVACTPEQYKLVFQNIAHRSGYKEVLSAQYDKLLYLFAEWVTDLATRRMDQYNVRIMERNRERTKIKEEMNAIRQQLAIAEAERDQLKHELKMMHSGHLEMIIKEKRMQEALGKTE